MKVFKILILAVDHQVDQEKHQQMQDLKTREEATQDLYQQLDKLDPQVNEVEEQIETLHQAHLPKLHKV
jgi:uncharacterized protein YdcH (DUF465 family)